MAMERLVPCTLGPEPCDHAIAIAGGCRLKIGARRGLFWKTKAAPVMPVRPSAQSSTRTQFIHSGLEKEAANHPLAQARVSFPTSPNF
eukprot:scaffold315204_cov36-Tisochrysis_lutea.AAC.4